MSDTLHRPRLSGTARIYCVHDRPKRAVAELEYDLRDEKVHLCACCENLFLERSDAPMFCPQCRGPLRHAQRGALPNPIGVVHG